MGKDEKGNAGASTSGGHIPRPYEVDLDNCVMDEARNSNTGPKDAGCITEKSQSSGGIPQPYSGY